MHVLNDNSKNLIKYIVIAFTLLAVILFMGLNLPGSLFAAEDSAKTAKEEEKATNDNAKEEEKATKDAAKEEEKATNDAAKEKDLAKDNKIDKINIKENIPEVEKVSNLGKNAEDDIDSLEELLEIIEITDQNQILDIKAVMEENEIVDILDVNEIINENNYLEIEYTDIEDTNIHSDNSLEFLWNKIKEFAYYYNS